MPVNESAAARIICRERLRKPKEAVNQEECLVDCFWPAADAVGGGLPVRVSVPNGSSRNGIKALE
jgi:hypothetical protein